MKILRLISSIDPKTGGPIEGARQIDAALISRGQQIELVTLDTPTAGSFLDEYPATVHALGPSRGGYRYNERLVAWLRANRKRFDAVIVDGLWQYHGLAAWRALAGTDTPYFVFAHGMLSPWFKRTYPFKHLKKWMYWPWADYRLLRDASLVFFTCEEEKRLARQSFWLYSVNEAVVSLGTTAPPQDHDGSLAAAFREAHQIGVDKRLILFLGRLHHVKGCDLIVEAFARVAGQYRDLHLVMAGPDQTGWQPRLKEQAQSLGIADRITWTGMLRTEAKWAAFHAAEVFCLPSHQENFGMVVAESLGCGTPVLISDKVNIWREIACDGAGIVNGDTSQGTLAGLIEWLEKPPAEQQAMVAAARACFERRYRIEQVADDLLGIISATLQAKAKE